MSALWREYTRLVPLAVEVTAKRAFNRVSSGFADLIRSHQDRDIRRYHLHLPRCSSHLHWGIPGGIFRVPPIVLLVQARLRLEPFLSSSSSPLARGPLHVALSKISDKGRWRLATLLFNRPTQLT